MRVLFDKNVPYGARHFLSSHQVETVEDRGWARISNGELLQAAEAAGFEVVVTADQNIVYQQTLEGREIALVVLGSNILADCPKPRDSDQRTCECSGSWKLCFHRDATAIEAPIDTIKTQKRRPMRTAFNVD